MQALLAWFRGLRSPGSCSLPLSRRAESRSLIARSHQQPSAKRSKCLHLRHFSGKKLSWARTTGRHRTVDLKCTAYSMETACVHTSTRG